MPLHRLSDLFVAFPDLPFAAHARLSLARDLPHATTRAMQRRAQATVHARLRSTMARRRVNRSLRKVRAPDRGG